MRFFLYLAEKCEELLEVMFIDLFPLLMVVLLLALGLFVWQACG